MKITLTPSTRYENHFSISYQAPEGLEFIESEALINACISAFEYAGEELEAVISLIDADYKLALDAKKVKEQAIKATLERLASKFPTMAFFEGV